MVQNQSQKDRQGMDQTRFESQIRFLIELDKLKSVVRQTYLTCEDRRENSAEHSWHLSMMAIILTEYSNEPVDICHVLKLLLIHDLVEIDAGDTYCYDEEASKDQVERERLAAERLFNLLPDDQAERVHDLWREYADRQSAEAKFAAAMDHLMPLLHSFYTGGRSWAEHGIQAGQVLSRNQLISEGSAPLWEYAKSIIDVSVREGLLTPTED